MNDEKTYKPKCCKGCLKAFTPARRFQAACCIPCAIQIGQDKRAKAERKAERCERERVKPRAQWLREVQTVFNAYVRARDAQLPCISCGRFHDGQWHAGHFLSVGARPELRFDERNCWRQCAPCNTHLHGNLVLYRAELIRRIGLDEVERLEGPHAAKKYDVHDLGALRAHFKAKLRELNTSGQ